MTPKAEQFWKVYERELALRVAAHRDEYATGEGETPEDYARAVIAKMRPHVERGRRGDLPRPSFAEINYRDSIPARRAAKAVGVAFNLEGLNGLYEGVQS